MQNQKTDTKIELKWYEKKQGVKFSQKKKKVEGKQIRKEKRAMESEINKDPASEKTFKSGDSKNVRHAVEADVISSVFNPSLLPKDCLPIITKFGSLVDSIFPINSKQKVMLSEQIRELSHNLTDERQDRRLGYMNQVTTTSAYNHYYLWWNIIRLTRLFANLQTSFFSTVSDNSICLDIGSGPLTVPIALFLACPELRKKKLVWYCMDISSQILASGEDIFLSVAAKLECEPWKIIRVKGEFGTAIKEKVDLVTAANVFNEIVQDSDMPPDYLAKKYSTDLLSYVNKNNANAKVLVIEPGVPSCARFLSLLRDALMRNYFMPCSPCPHTAECPMSGKRGGKWCNYAFSTEDAPRDLKKLSESASLAKERAVLSFIAAEKNESGQDDSFKESGGVLKFRIASDEIRLPGNRTGYYACSEKGLLLVVAKKKYFSGELLSIPMPNSLTRMDRKSGARVIEII
ncbi:MAG: small ribosomal subunit Rsm22 family protein [Treponema sp.]|nr:small ribosomal subunit Rsm22 family protein [Treponema sp.]